MSLVERAVRLGEAFAWPDGLTRAAIAFLVERTRRRIAGAGEADDRAFAEGMAAYPIAMNTAEANAQHYEVPADFFGLVLGPQRKYSCCLYDGGAQTLAEAEERALAQTAGHAGLADGQRILELGCGWGSLSLWMARRFPQAAITAVSNSHSQRAFIEGEAAARGLPNLRVVTADMNHFDIEETFERVVSVEMFEHMANWRPLLTKIRRWLAPDGRLFIHIFTHAKGCYRFSPDDREDWIAQHFFTGGVMPSHGLIRQFGDLFSVAQDWRWSGDHYRRTADDWLARLDAGADAATPILRKAYGADAELWRRRWRLFFLATSGLFGHSGGGEWGVSHYLLAPAR